MAKNFGRVNVSITASTGGLTRGLANAGKQLSGFQGMVSRLTGGMGSGFASATLGVLGLGRGASTAAVGVALLSTAMKSLLLPLGVIAALTAPFVAIGKAMAYAEGVHNLATELGVASGQLQVLQHAAGEVGVSQEQLTAGLRRTARMTSELAAGTPAAVKAFQGLGLTMQDMAGLDTAGQFALIADRIAALPPEMQAAAAIDIFGRSGQGMLNFLRQGGEGIREMDALLTALGVKMSGEQTAAIEGMGDALGRLSLLVQGFINQFTAGVAPAITAVANLVVDFFAKNTSGWSLASSLANGFVFILRTVVGGFTFIYGVLQLASAGLAAMGQIGMNAFGFLLKGLSAVQEGIAVLMDVIGMLGKFLVDMIMAPIKGIMSTVASMAEAVGATDIAADLRLGMKVADGLTEGWDKFGNVVRGTTFLEDAANDAFSEAGVYGAAADGLAASGIANVTNPFGAFDAALARANKDAADNAANGGKPGQPGAGPVAQAVGAAIRASSQELKAIVVGSSEGETFRNNILRGADPRLDVKDDAAATAQNTERSADALEDIADRLDPTGLAVIG
jgi:hypothetical protein